MALNVVLLVFLALALRDASFEAVNSSVNTAELTSVLTTLQEHLSVSSFDYLNIINQALVREIEVRVKHQTELEDTISTMREQQNQIKQELKLRGINQERLESRIAEMQIQLNQESQARATNQGHLVSRITELKLEADARVINQTSTDSRIAEQEIQLKQEVDARVINQSHISSKITELQIQMANCTVDPTIAFSARGTPTEQDGLTAKETIIFQDVLTNFGGGYNKDTSTFSCPVRGLYQFVVTIMVKPSSRAETELVASGVSRMVVSSAGEPYYGSGTNSVLLELRAGDEVYVRLYNEMGPTVYGHLYSTFNGHLVHKL